MIVIKTALYSGRNGPNQQRYIRAYFTTTDGTIQTNILCDRINENFFPREIFVPDNTQWMGTREYDADVLMTLNPNLFR